jgi:hypothetical protein
MISCLFFVDTNFAVGYTVIHDKWHEKAKNFVEKNDEIYWSNLVQKEYEYKLGDIENTTEFFLKRVKLILKNTSKDFINYEDFETYILKKTKACTLDRHKKQMILEKFWNRYDFNYEITEVIYSKFENFADEFNKIYAKRDKTLKSQLILHNCGLDNYLRYKAYVKVLYDWGVHNPDCKIIVDAHDCGKTHENLIFVSTDVEMINKIITHNTSFLNIIEFKPCN